MLRAIDISTSALVAQRQRMNTIATNIAQVNTTRDAEGNVAPFQRRFVTFFAETESQNSPQPQRGTGVEFQVEIDTETPARREHNPGHPDADADGYVLLPNIDLVTEFTNALEASRAYEANVAAIDTSKQMASMTLRILA